MSVNQSSVSAVTNSPLKAAQESQKFDHYRAAPVDSSSDAQQFSQRLAGYREQRASPVANVTSAENSNSLGDRVMKNVSELSSKLGAEHKKVSAMIERATTTGDSTLMLRATMELGNYSQHAQMITKTVSKAATGLESLTRLQ